MNWLFWRQYRKQLLFTGLGLAIYLGAVLALGIHAHHAFHQKIDSYKYINGATRYLPLASLVLPLLYGLFWGAPLLAKEYEEGTNKLAWTQGVSRRRWLTAKLGWTAAAAVLYGGLTALTVSYALQPEHAVWFDRFEWVHFDVAGLMPAVYSLFAIALGSAIGAWTRHVLRALGITLAIFVALQGVMALYVRPQYHAPLSSSTTTVFSVPAAGGESTTLSTTTTGTPLPSNSSIWRLGFSGKDTYQPGCPGPQAGKNATCWNRDTQTIRFQPAKYYWPFQFVEAGIYLALTAVLIGTTYWAVLRRDA